MRKEYLEPFPEVFYTLKANRKLSQAEVEKIRVGSRPEHMDDKWFIYFEDPWLCFHRVPTGRCIWKIHILRSSSDYLVDEILVNGDTEQYNIKPNELEFSLEILDLFLASKIR
jgi:hypothetical protein